MALDRRWFFQVTAERQRIPIDNSASILNTQIVRFCLFNTVVFSCFFLYFGRIPRSFVFVRFVVGLARKMRGTKKVGHENVGSVGQKNDGDAHPEPTDGHLDAGIGIRVPRSSVVSWMA